MNFFYIPKQRNRRLNLLCHSMDTPIPAKFFLIRLSGKVQKESTEVLPAGASKFLITARFSAFSREWISANAVPLLLRRTGVPIPLPSREKQATIESLPSFCGVVPSAATPELSSVDSRPPSDG